MLNTPVRRKRKTIFEKNNELNEPDESALVNVRVGTENDRSPLGLSESGVRTAVEKKFIKEDDMSREHRSPENFHPPRAYQNSETNEFNIELLTEVEQKPKLELKQ